MSVTLQRLSRGARLSWGQPLLVAALVVVAATLGALSGSHQALALLVAVTLLVVGFVAGDIGLVTVLAVPATLVMVRVGGAMSLSDFVLGGATVVALVLLDRREAQDLRPLVWAGIAYAAALVPTLVLNRYAANVIEWVHELVLILGSLVVGWVVGRRGSARTALSAYLVGCCLIGVAAFVQALYVLGDEGTFGPAYLPYLHKNFIGATLALALVIAYARPDWVGWSWGWTSLAIVVCGAGIAASGSRQAIVSAVVGVVVVNLRNGVGPARRSRLVWFAAIPLVIFVVRSVLDQLASGDRFNSTSQRLAWFQDSVDIWQTSPVFGVGLRWWYTDRFPVSFQPPNAELEMLTSGGVVGTAGFLVLFVVAAWSLTAMDPRFGTVALAVVLTRFTQGQLDLYWAAGQSSMLWIVAGMAYGALRREREAEGLAGAVPLASRPRRASYDGAA